ncbi:MAG: hypothetical protein ACP5UZ_08100 [Thermoplasmata archaeon]
MSNGNKIEETESCPLYEKCECPLCPLANNPMQVWYSEDDICKNPDFETISRSMKKLKRKAAQGYFTLDMLNRDFIVRRGTEGVDPDLPDTVKDPLKEYERREKAWLHKHPEISRERSDNLIARGKSLAESRKSIQKVPSDNAFSEMTVHEGIIRSLDFYSLKN